MPAAGRRRRRGRSTPRRAGRPGRWPSARAADAALAARHAKARGFPARRTPLRGAAPAPRRAARASASPPTLHTRGRGRASAPPSGRALARLLAVACRQRHRARRLLGRTGRAACCRSRRWRWRPSVPGVGRARRMPGRSTRRGGHRCARRRRRPSGTCQPTVRETRCERERERVLLSSGTTQRNANQPSQPSQPMYLCDGSYLPWCACPAFVGMGRRGAAHGVRQRQYSSASALHSGAGVRPASDRTSSSTARPDAALWIE